MKILLLSPPYLPEYMRNARCDFVSLSATQWYPIWLGYCGCFLEKHGYEVKLIDSPAYGLNHAQTESLFLDYKPDVSNYEFDSLSFLATDFHGLNLVNSDWLLVTGE